MRLWSAKTLHDAQVIVAKIKSLSQSHVVHPGLDLFRQPHFAPDQTSGTGDAEEDARRAAARKLDPSLVPGLKESGWTPEMDELYVLSGPFYHL